MKKSILVAIAFIAATSSTSQLFAQDAAAKSAGYDLKKKCKMSSDPNRSGMFIGI